jgi:hypothetical protein
MNRPTPPASRVRQRLYARVVTPDASLACQTERIIRQVERLPHSDAFRNSRALACDLVVRPSRLGRHVERVRSHPHGPDLPLPPVR